MFNRLTPSKRLSRLYAAFPLLLAVYVPLAFTPYFIPGWKGQKEIFPFFSWDLFSLVPQREMTDYSVRIVAVDGVRLPKPVFYAEAGSRVENAGSITAYRHQQSMGRAAAKQDEAALAKLVDSFESNHLLRGRTYDYELVQRHYDPVARWRKRQYHELTVFRTYRHRRVSNLDSSPTLDGEHE